MCKKLPFLGSRVVKVDHRQRRNKILFMINHPFYLHFLGLQVTDLLASLGSPGPASLTAFTLNSYSVPSSKFGTVALVLSFGPTCLETTSHEVG